MRIISEPASAKAMAISAPIPRVPPVITAVRPARENMSTTDDDILTVDDYKFAIEGSYESQFFSDDAKGEDYVFACVTGYQ